VTVEADAYCWGSNDSGQVGIGTTGYEGGPVQVAGGLKFLQVSPGRSHTCGLTIDSLAYCWGANSRAQLGDRTTTQRRAPAVVAGGLRFREISAGGLHTCALADDGKAYCWGWNRYGQLGDSTQIGRRYRPRLVAGGHVFRRVSAGASHTCGVTKTNRAWCWGFGQAGELGTGRAHMSFWPRRVAGGHSFRSVSASDESHTCGIGTEGQAYCWGLNPFGELGNGSLEPALAPVRVAGDIPFDSISTGRHHTEALAGTVGYHWGLVDGEGTSNPAPLPGVE
jgi:alpha-tubulin suppressor-like RCC1 family protein